MARDKHHQAVRTALEKAGWVVTHDPFYLVFGGVNYEIDLGAENILAAERDHQQIAIEVKSFLRESVANEFHAAIGQFINYQYILEEKEPTRMLFLAINQVVFESFFQLPFTQGIIRKHRIHLLVFDPVKEEVIVWQPITEAS
jgi:hypothetical protein